MGGGGGVIVLDERCFSSECGIMCSFEKDDEDDATSGGAGGGGTIAVLPLLSREC